MRMKRFFAAVCAVVLLTGCAAELPESSDGETLAPETIPTHPGFYDSASDVEAETDGAVRGFLVEIKACLGMATMGEDILLFSGESPTSLTLLVGEKLVPTVTVTLDCGITPGMPGVQVSEKGVAYYNREKGCVVFLDTSLRETGRVELPQNMQGAPAIAPAMDLIYYCTQTQIRVIELQNGIDRMLKEQDEGQVTLTQILFSGKVLEYAALGPDGQSRSYVGYVSTETGETLGMDSQVRSMDAGKDLFFFSREEGSVLELLFGEVGKPIQKLSLPSDAGTVSAALALDGVVTWKNEGACLDVALYDLLSGKRVSSIALKGERKPCGFLADGKNRCLWILFSENAAEEAVLYRWDVAATSVTEDRVYTGPWYTAKSPDLDGLAECDTRAAEMGEKYGVDVNIFPMDIPAPGDYALEAEFLVDPLRQGLEELERVLSQFPEGFFPQALKGTGTGILHIGLVRDVAGPFEGIQYWKNGDAYIAIEVRPGMTGNIYHELFHVIDSHVLGNCKSYDTWSSLNPKDFEYDYDYTISPGHQNSEYLQGENRAFTDAYAMSFPVEDRCRIFEYAMSPDGVDCFDTEIMQSKLRTVCEGIRRAFGWKKDSREFPWEQYLEEPLAYRESE